MRYDKEIFFVKAGKKTYHKSTGNYTKGAAEETKVYASIMDTGRDTMNLVYGAIRQGSFTIHIQNHYDGIFDSIRIGEKHYRVDHRRRLRFKESFVVSEVP